MLHLNFTKLLIHKRLNEPCVCRLFKPKLHVRVFKVNDNVFREATLNDFNFLFEKHSTLRGQMYFLLE